MRFALLFSFALVLSGCQMALGPAEPAADVQFLPQSGVDEEGAALDSDQEQAPSDEEQLAAAFEEAASALDAPKPKGVFAFLKKKPDPSPLEGSEIELTRGSAPEGALAALPSAPIEAETSAEAPEEAEESLTPPSQKNAEEEPVEKKRKQGFFARLAGDKASAKTAQKPKSASTVAPGEVLPFGVTGVACEIKKSTLGKAVDQYPKKGSAAWKLYDTDPSATGPRTQFITGFSDGCARQVTAALVIFGSAGVHETHRYAKANTSDWTAADKAYEKIKSSLCGVGRGKFCPEGKLGGLEKSVAFVSIYPTFGGYDDTYELLLSKGSFVADGMR